MVDNQGTHAYGYDDKYQLSTATHPIDPAESFAYDPVGNRTTSHISPSYTYNAANQLLEDAEFTYAYDLDGNCVGKVSKLNGERHEYIFNSENRMTGYRKYDIANTLLTSADYFYDAIGRRIAKNLNTVLTRYIYHEEDIWMQLRADGWPERYYFHGPGIDEPLWTWQGEFTPSHFYMPDGLGTIRNLRDYTANPIVTSFTYDAFGQITSSSPVQGAPDIYRYTGREWDSESGLYYYRARYYDPRAGRFTAEDPVRYNRGIRPPPEILGHPVRVLSQLRQDTYAYAYVTQNPVRWRDPSGQDILGIGHMLHNAAYWCLCLYYTYRCADEGIECAGRWRERLTDMQDDPGKEGELEKLEKKYGTRDPAGLAIAICFIELESCKKMRESCGHGVANPIAP